VVLLFLMGAANNLLQTGMTVEGAVATHLIHNDPVTNILLPVIFGIIVWVSIWLRSEKLRALC
ncbi:hypothetical protein, partial [Maribacter arcticus]|uniref:hypothetical protein n=2 Tax=Maribacter arcticus TaxID=561365 RepID=UPI0030027A6A